MSAKAKLSDIVDALETAMDGVASYLNRDTGEVLTIQDEFMSQAQEEDAPEEGTPKWQVDAYNEALEIVQHPDRFLELPDKWDIHEYSIMEDFSRSVENARLREELLNAISGRGAFRYFKDILYRRNIQKNWYAFREDALREIAADWRKENDIAFE